MGLNPRTPDEEKDRIETAERLAALREARERQPDEAPGPAGAAEDDDDLFDDVPV
jgi:hypothetical protein